MMTESPYDQHLIYLRDRMRAIKADPDLTRSARTSAITELVDAAVHFTITFQLMSVKPGPEQRHRTATEEEVRERVAACVGGVSIERFVADMADSGISEEQAWDTAYYAGYGDIELWGMTIPEAIRAGRSLGVPYDAALARQ